MRRILREPLLHFLLLGAAFFVAWRALGNRGRGDDRRAIVVTQGEIEHLATGFARTWQRPPTADELAGLVRDHVREEVYFREAMALGLDKDDSVIRRRLSQKMEFLSEDLAARVEPTDADLNAYLRSHAGAFRIEPRLTFRQVFVDPEKHGRRLEADTEDLLARLNRSGAGADLSALGDPFLLEHDFSAAASGEVAREFGKPFAEKLRNAVIGRWQGPIESGYGLHLVFVAERTDGRLPELSEVREAVRRAWDDDHRSQANAKFYRDLLGRYTVTIEEPGTPEPRKLALNIQNIQNIAK